MKIVRSFISLNQKACSRIESFLPHSKPDLTQFYDDLVSDLINLEKFQVVADLGSGRAISYASKIKSKTQIVAIDNSEEELKFNKIAAKKIVADLNSLIPLQKKSVDLLTSRYLLEHLENPNSAFKNMSQVLTKNGKIIHLFSTKNAPFAILNRLLPNFLSKNLLLWLVPGSKDIRGFKTHYKLNHTNLLKLLKKNGFKVDKVYLSFYQSRYFAFFLPLYLLAVLYELTIYKLNLRNLASYIIVIAYKD